METASDELKAILDSIPELPVELSERIDAESRLEKLKVPRPTIPDDDPDLKYPKDLTSIGPEKLGHIYGQYMAWTGYCRYLLNLKEADILLVKNTLLMVRKKLQKDILEISRYDKSSAEARKVTLDGDTSVLQLERLLTKFEVEKKVVEARFYHFDNCAKALSREISRRNGENGKTQLGGSHDGDTVSYH